MLAFLLFICLFLLFLRILHTYFFKLLLFIKFGRLIFFMILCHSQLTFCIQLIFPHFVRLLFLPLKRIYSTNIIYLIFLKYLKLQTFLAANLNLPHNWLLVNGQFPSFSLIQQNLKRLHIFHLRKNEREF